VEEDERAAGARPPRPFPSIERSSLQPRSAQASPSVSYPSTATRASPRPRDRQPRRRPPRLANVARPPPPSPPRPPRPLCVSSQPRPPTPTPALKRTRADPLGLCRGRRDERPSEHGPGEATLARPQGQLSGRQEQAGQLVVQQDNDGRQEGPAARRCGPLGRTPPRRNDELTSLLPPSPPSSLLGAPSLTGPA